MTFVMIRNINPIRTATLIYTFRVFFKEVGHFAANLLDIINRTFCSCSYCLFTSLRFGIIPFDLLLLNLFFTVSSAPDGLPPVSVSLPVFQSASFSGCPLFPASRHFSVPAGKHLRRFLLTYGHLLPPHYRLLFC